MSIFLNQDSKVIVQGMTGSEGMKHTTRMLASGTAIVGEPSNPDRLASMTTGRSPLAALIARATFFDDSGNSVPADH